MSLGDFDAGSVLYFKFTTFRPSTGAPFTLAGTPAISVYKDASTTQSTSGVTLTADFDSVTGLNHVAIDTSADGAFYAAGSFFDVVVTTGTVDSVSAVGVVVGRFTLRKTACLKPTTAGRTLDVSAGGEAGIDLANVGSPTTTLNLSGTTIKAVTDRVSANTDQLAGQTVTAAGAVTFPSTVSSLTAAGVRTELSTELGRIDVATSTRLASSAYTTPPTAGAIADAVWDEPLGDHLASGSTGAGLNAAGSAGDPWSTSLPGAYGSGTAGFILGTNLNATITSRLATSGYTAPLDAAGTRSALGLASANLDTQLDALPTAVENAAAVWNAAIATHTATGSFGQRVLRSTNTQAEVQVNGNGHVASVLHSSEPDSITVGAFAADSITASALAAGAATEIATATLTSAMTESYRAAGVAPTLAQAAFELLAHMGDSSISGTTKTLKKIDGTTAKTFTLDSSTAPTSITEAT